MAVVFRGGVRSVVVVLLWCDGLQVISTGVQFSSVLDSDYLAHSVHRSREAKGNFREVRLCIVR